MGKKGNKFSLKSEILTQAEKDVFRLKASCLFSNSQLDDVNVLLQQSTNLLREQCNTLIVSFQSSIIIIQ